MCSFVGVGYLGLFGLRLLKGPWSGEEASGFVPEEAGAPGVRSIPGEGVYTWEGGIRSRYYGICV